MKYQALHENQMRTKMNICAGSSPGYHVTRENMLPDKCK